MNNQHNTNTISILDQALELLENRGWSVIPVGENKHPLIPWKQYQEVAPTVEQVREWFTKYPTANVGIITGKISGLTVVDIDPRHGGTDDEFKDLDTVKVKTGGGGFHVYFLYEAGIKNGANLKPGIDIRSEGGYVIAPPSLHESGNRYEWMIAPSDKKLLALPNFVKDWIKQPKNHNSDKASSWNDDILNGVGEGQRNTAAASVIGKYLNTFIKSEWETVAWPTVVAWNGKNTPPLPEDELRATFDSIRLKELQGGDSESSGRESLAKELVSEILQSDILLFHDTYKEGFASMTGDGREIIKLKTKTFRKWVARLAYKEFDKIASGETVANVIQTLEGHAMFEGDMYPLAVRVTEYQNIIWYDLGNGQAVKIDTNGWSIIEKPPILFKQFPHQEQQVIPAMDGTVAELCNFVNLKNDQDRLLFQVFAVASFIPNFPHPLLVLHGPQGAGKSTPMRVLKSLIDPSVLRTLSMPDSEREFAQLASHHHFFFFDNLSTLPGWLSDSLAKASTGDGFSKRELYSDDDDVIYSFQRTMGINGINLVVEKADLLDRSILLGLERITKQGRRQEQEFWKKFDEVKPQLLGAIFTAVSKAMVYYPQISLASYPRMADFTRWGCAIARALGYKDTDFITAYFANIDAQSEAAIDSSPVGTAIMGLMEVEDTWHGTPSQLLTALEEAATSLKINIRGKGWPKEPSWLIRKIQVVIPNLLEQGIKVERDEKARPKTITIQKVGKNGDDADMPTTSVKSVPTTTLSPSIGETINADALPDGVKGLSDQSTSSPTPPSAESPDNQDGTQRSLSKAQKILKNNIKTEQVWNETMKEFGIDH